MPRRVRLPAAAPRGGFCPLPSGCVGTSIEVGGFFPERVERRVEVHFGFDVEDVADLLRSFLNREPKGVGSVAWGVFDVRAAVARRSSERVAHASIRIHADAPDRNFERVAFAISIPAFPKRLAA
ncbi:MAG: hypothetical protein VW445_09315 [Rhodospirillaceae bacterium]